MRMLDIHNHARKLLESRGERAPVEAAQQARQYEANGDEFGARNWRRIEAAIREMRGPFESR